VTKLEGLGCDGALLAGSPAHPKHAAKSALESISSPLEGKSSMPSFISPDPAERYNHLVAFWGYK